MRYERGHQARCFRGLLRPLFSKQYRREHNLEQVFTNVSVAQMESHHWFGPIPFRTDGI